jgi:uncharacterized membrane-anchored protein
MLRSLIGVSVLSFLMSVSGAEEPKADAPAYAYHPLTGTVTVGKDLAIIELPEGYHYLQTAEARHVVEAVWGNPPDEDTLGLVLPPKVDVKDWGIIVAYANTGYIKDDDEKKINYDDVLKSMQQEATENKPARKENGYPTYELRGWAEPPHYDSQAKKMYWAKSARFEGEPIDTLNYDIRILGRRGYITISAISSVDKLATVAESSKLIMTKTEFTPGNRYADFSESSGDTVSNLGLIGLVAGGGLLAAKLGIFKIALLFIVKFAKIILIGGAAIVGLVAKVLGKRPKTSPMQPAMKDTQITS